MHCAGGRQGHGNGVTANLVRHGTRVYEGLAESTASEAVKTTRITSKIQVILAAYARR